MKIKKISAKEILEEIALENYISDANELSELKEKCNGLLLFQENSPENKQAQIQAAIDFTQSLWKKFDCQEIADLFMKFQRIEEALFGLERDEVSGSRYREHFVHMFNCFVFGLRFIHKISSGLPEDDVRSLFKVENENLKEVGLPFGENYSHTKRLFYIWTLISTFHDIAIPFQHLKKIGSGINNFVKEFGWEFSDSKVTMKSYDSSQLHSYFDLLGRLYGGKLVMEKGGRKYVKQTEPHYYISKLLGREFDIGNHGVLSGFFLWKTIEELFLVSKTSKYKFSIDQFNKYSEYVLEQDIARASLAVSLHNLPPDARSGFLPQVFPISFKEYPLTFLLILADELQEYLRWEGTSIENTMRFSWHPKIEVVKHNKKVISIRISLSWDENAATSVIDLANSIVRHNKGTPNIATISEAADVVGNQIKESLENKLCLGKDFLLSFQILKDWKSVLFMKDLSSKTETN